MKARRVTLTCGLLAALALAVGVTFAQEHQGPHWTYGGADGPAHWGELDKAFSACQQGHHQSPIDIRSPTAADLPPIQFAYRPTPLHIVNNGHTIQVNYAPGSFITVGNKKFELKQFHFHHPSEEKINGKGFAMVAHLVHAAPDGSLAVVAVLLDPGAANSQVASAWQHLPSHEGPEEAFDNAPIDATGLLPADRGYYTMRISQAQADAFGKIYPIDARPTQPLYDRHVLMTR
jgi:carbonic anhydrase